MKLICPHCGASAGVWQKFEAIQYYDVDGKPDGYNNEPFSEGKCCIVTNAINLYAEHQHF